MQIDGAWWYLVEEEPFDPERTKQLSFDDGAVLDARTDERIGAYAVDGDKLVAHMADGTQIVATVRESESTVVSATLIENHGDEEIQLPALLSRTEARVLPLFA